MNNLLASSVLQTIFGVVIAIMVLLLTITVHEFGHYIVGKILKFKITEFAIGMGPAIFKRKMKNGEIFSIRIFPLGGFCAFEGEDDAGAPGANKKDYKQEENSKTQENQEHAETQETQAKVFEDMPEPKGELTENSVEKTKTEQNTTGSELSPNAFDNKKPWERILVLIAGGITNIIFAILIVAINFSIYGHFCLTTGEVIPASGALEQSYSLMPGDKLVEIDGHYLYLTSDLVALKAKKKGDKVKVKVERDGQILEKEIVLRSDVDNVTLTEYFDAFDALGVGTTLIINTTAEDAIFPNGAYLIGMSDGVNLTCTKRIYTVKELFDELSNYSSNQNISFIINENGEEKILNITIPDGFEAVAKAEYKTESERIAKFKEFFKIDSFYIQYDIASTVSRLGFFEGIYRAPVYGFKTTIVSLQSLFGLFSGEVGLDQVSGPVGTISMTSQVVSMGFNYVLEIAAMIGISIGVFNLLPIPALDGGRVVFVVIEWIRGKPIKKNIEATIHFVGLIALLAFAVIVDLIKIF